MSGNYTNFEWHVLDEFFPCAIYIFTLQNTSYIKILTMSAFTNWFNKNSGNRPPTVVAPVCFTHVGSMILPLPKKLDLMLMSDITEINMTGWLKLSCLESWYWLQVISKEEISHVTIIFTIRQSRKSYAQLLHISRSTSGQVEQRTVTYM